MSNQTFKNEENNRGQKLKNEALSLLRPLWLGMRDSNPRSRDQNPLPYRLANPQCLVSLLSISDAICKRFWTRTGPIY